MSEKLEFDLVVKNNDLDKVLTKASKSSEQLEANLKQASAVLSKRPISAGVQESVQNLTVNSAQFKNEIGLAFGAAVKGAQNAEKEFQKTKKSLTESTQAGTFFGNALQVASGVFLGNVLINTFTSIKNALTDAAKESIDFKRSLLEVETILPKNTKLTAEMVRELEDLSRQYGTSATTQAKAYYEVISAGVGDAADATKLLGRANELATGGITDAAKTIDLLTTIYNVYGKEIATTEEATDSLFKTVQIGKTTIPELAQSFGEILPVAKNLGIGLDEVGSGLALLTNAGFKTAEAGTLLNALFAAIARNGKELGPTMNSTAVQTDGLGVVIERLAKRTNLSNDALFNLLGRQEAVKAVISLSQGGLAKYNESLAEYSNKAGVASDASKKILEGDVSKQWDIFTESISQTTRSIFDGFIPAANAALTAINGFKSLRQQADEAISLDTKLIVLRNSLARLTEAYNEGKNSASSFAIESAKIKSEIEKLSNALPTANNPLVTALAGARAEAASLTSQINSLNFGLDGLTAIGPIEASLKVSDLTEKLKKTNEEIKKLSTSTIAPPAPPPDERDKTAIANEKKLQGELQALRVQFATEAQTFEDQLFIAEQDATTIRGELVTAQIYDQKVREAEATYQGELLKNQYILDAQEQKAANDLANQKREDAMIKAANTKVLTDTRQAKSAQIALEQSFQNSRNTLIGQGFTLAATLAKDGSKTQFLIQKAGALAEIAIADGKARALIPAQTALIPFPANVAAAASLNAYVTAQTALGAAIVGAAAIKGYADGGIVGATSGPDNRIATVRDGEMVLNASQQGKLFDMINGGAGSAPIVIQIDGRTIATAVRDQIQSGFRLA